MVGDLLVNKIRFSDFKDKEVINCRDGARLGFVCDLIFDAKNGNIIKIIIPGPCKIWGMLGRDNEYIISFCSIKQIGEDVILVDIDAQNCLIKIPF